MATYSSFKKKFRKEMHPGAWTILSHGLQLLYGPVGGVESGNGSGSGMGMDADLDEYGTPELVIASFLDIYEKCVPENRYLRYESRYLERRYGMWTDSSLLKDLSAQTVKNLASSFKERKFDADEFFLKLYDEFTRSEAPQVIEDTECDADTECDEDAEYDADAEYDEDVEYPEDDEDEFGFAEIDFDDSPFENTIQDNSGKQDDKRSMEEKKKYLAERFRVVYAPQAAVKRGRKNAFIAGLKERIEECGRCGEMFYADQLLNMAYDCLESEGKICQGADDPDGKQSEEQKGRFASMTSEYAELQRKLLECIVNQDVAVRRFTQGYYSGKLRDENEVKGPESSFLFVGPPGVGKTFLARKAGELCNRPVQVFDMSEYASQESFCGLVGFERTWKNAQEGALTKYVDENPNAILVFDEIEKAHARTKHLFLSILEGGFLKDLFTEKEVDFTNTVVIFTTNAGREFFEEKKEMRLSLLSEETLVDALEKDKDECGVPKMPPEILSRLRKGHIIGFDHMDPVKLVRLIKQGMNKSAGIIHDKFGFDVDYDSSLLPYIFLYHMGENLDARVATYRSESFIKDAVLKAMERMGNSSKMNADEDGHGNSMDRAIASIPENFFMNGNTALKIEVLGNDLVDELILLKDRPEVLVICRKEDRAKFPRSDKRYNALFMHEDSFRQDAVEKIKTLLKKRRIEAILIDPFMMESDAGGKKPGELFSAETTGIRVMEQILALDDRLKVYCMELGTEKISYVDRQRLFEEGISGVLEPIGDKGSDGMGEVVYSLCYELFLSKKLNRLFRKGKRLNFDIRYHFEQTDCKESLVLSLCDFKLDRNMNSEAYDIFIDDDPEYRDSFDNVVGGESAKEELKRYISFLKDPDEYLQSGQQVSKGVLLYGPPGTGKTKLARALACEAECPFITATGTQFIRGEKKITNVFRLARKYAPSVIFIDEIESFAKDSSMGGRYPELVKELMTEMDGFKKSSNPVFVIAATNAASAPDLGERNIYLDEALLRRFTKKVYMKWPTRDERIEFIKREQEKYKDKQFNLNALSPDDIRDFADMAAGHSLAEMENVIELAVGKAAERKATLDISLLAACFEESVYGEERKYSKEHIFSTAIHEAGHAFMGFFCEGFKYGRLLPEYATIIARGGYLGMVRQKNDEDRTGYSRDELLKLVRIKLAGRAAETVFDLEKNGGMTTGAANDLESATNIVTNLITKFGMEEGFMVSLSMDVIMKSALAEKYYNRINEILLQEMRYAIEVIRENRDKVKRLADELMDKSRLDAAEMAEILGAEIEEPEGGESYESWG